MLDILGDSLYEHLKLKLAQVGRPSASKPTGLVALVDSLGNGTLNEMQRETVRALREGILSLARKEEIRV